MSLYDALEDSAVHKATQQQGQIIITVTDQAPHLPKRSYPDHFLIGDARPFQVSSGHSLTTTIACVVMLPKH